MGVLLKNVIDEMQSDNQNNLFFNFWASYMKEREYQPESGRDVLKKKYDEIVKIYKNKQSENPVSKD